jgi:hypothetical protein
MINDTMIRMFCDTTGYSSVLQNPFNIDGFTYATNGHFAIKIPAIEEYAGFEKLDSVSGLSFCESTPVNLFTTLPALLDGVIINVKCNLCNGTGKNKTCSDCNGDGEVYWESYCGHEYEAECKECDGTGKVVGSSETCDNCNGTGSEVEDTIVTIGTKYLNTKLLDILAKLPGCMIATEAVTELKPIPFKFNGGVGIIMPCRKCE